MSASHYISTGAGNNYYTLRYRFTEWGWNRATGEKYPIERDYHIQNLSIDREAAIAKAREITGAALGADFEVRPIGERTPELDPSVIRFGKYRGRGVAEVAEEDPEYLCWCAENMTAKIYQETIDLIKALLAHRLAERSQEAQAEEQAATAKAAKTAEVLAPLAEVLEGCPGDFCASIARDMRKGHAPRGRAVNICCDIYGKAHGRRNSKAYDAAYDEASAVLEPCR